MVFHIPTTTPTCPSLHIHIWLIYTYIVTWYYMYTYMVLHIHIWYHIYIEAMIFENFDSVIDTYGIIYTKGKGHWRLRISDF